MHFSFYSALQNTLRHFTNNTLLITPINVKGNLNRLKHTHLKPAKGALDIKSSFNEGFEGVRICTVSDGFGHRVPEGGALSREVGSGG